MLHPYPRPDERIVIVSGGFDPLHSGHLKLFKGAKDLGEYLLVGVNSDQWLGVKKGKNFQNINERLDIINSLEMVNMAMEFDDSDGTACNLIDHVKKTFPSNKIIFANGGDRTSENVPEAEIVNIEFAWGIGGDKKTNSSSELLYRWGKHNLKTEHRPWGSWAVHRDLQTTKVKELVVEPHKSLSMQSHSKRAEHWFIAEGEATVYTLDKQIKSPEHKGVYPLHTTVSIKKSEWHMLCNETDNVLRIIEIQYGDACLENDIVRINV